MASSITLASRHDVFLCVCVSAWHALPWCRFAWPRIDTDNACCCKCDTRDTQLRELVSCVFRSSLPVIAPIQLALTKFNASTPLCTYWFIICARSVCGTQRSGLGDEWNTSLDDSGGNHFPLFQYRFPYQPPQIAGPMTQRRRHHSHSRSTTQEAQNSPITRKSDDALHDEGGMGTSN